MIRPCINLFKDKCYICQRGICTSKKNRWKKGIKHIIVSKDVKKYNCKPAFQAEGETYETLEDRKKSNKIL